MSRKIIKDKNVQIPLPPDVHAALKREAKENHRNMRQQGAVIMCGYFAAKAQGGAK